MALDKDAGAVPDAIEKLMSVSTTEYVKSIEAFAGPVAARTAALGEPVRLEVGGGRAVIAYAPQPGVRLGGLLELPRARVSITFEGLTAGERTGFLRAFDIAFQRGGG